MSGSLVSTVKSLHVSLHGGAYYQDGSRASGPPERGLFQYRYKIGDGKLLIKAGEMPTPGQPVANKVGGRSTCV